MRTDFQYGSRLKPVNQVIDGSPVTRIDPAGTVWNRKFFYFNSCSIPSTFCLRKSEQLFRLNVSSES